MATVAAVEAFVGMSGSGGGKSDSGGGGSGGDSQ
jgi:hypothetical protein